jgi:hypothetical protein
LLMPALLTLILFASPTPLVAQQPMPIEIETLPQPPGPIQSLIETSRVKFEAGPKQQPVASTGQPSIVAETRYRIAYNYTSQSSWRRVDRGRKLVVDVRYTKLQWKPMHTVWFLKPPAEQDFWSNRLVRHELDHVRISSDRRFAKQFEQAIRAQPVLYETIDIGEIVNRKFVDALVDRHVANAFAEISELIAIRYKELDRLTSHGLRPLSAESELQRWLKQERADSP